MKNLKFTLVRSLLFNLFIVSAVLLITYACSESDKEVNPDSTPFVCESCKTKPEALAVNDNSYKGIYIGVTSVGTVVVDVMNNSDKLTSTLTIDRDKVVLTADDIIEDKNIHYATFSGVHNGELLSFNFSVSSDGNNPKLSSTSIPELSIINKETSQFMLETFEGKYYTPLGQPDEISTEAGKVIDTTGNSTYIEGKYNIVIYRSQRDAYSKSNVSQASWWRGVAALNGKMIFHGGVIDGTNQLFDEGNRYSGTIKVDELKGLGVFLNHSHNKAYVYFKRTL